MKMFITMQRQVQLNLYLSCSSICSNTYATCFCPCGAECRILVPWPRNGIYAPAVEAWWLSNWTTTLNHFTTYTTHFHDHTFKIQLVEQLLSLSLSLSLFFFLLSFPYTITCFPSRWIFRTVYIKHQRKSWSEVKWYVLLLYLFSGWSHYITAFIVISHSLWVVFLWIGENLSLCKEI